MLKRKKKAVSPVIATILMVAITVVLSATLYMMISTEEPAEKMEVMTGELREVSYGWILEIQGGSVIYEEDKVQIYDTSTGAVLENVSAYTGSGNPPDIGTNISYKFLDNDNNDEITSGDSIQIGDDRKYLEDKYQIRIEGTSLRKEI